MALVLSALVGCGMHLGRPPAPFRVSRVEVVARAAEPGLPAVLEGAVRRALVERGAWGDDGGRLVLEIVSAGWGSWVTGGHVPTRELVLVVRARRGDGVEEVTVRRAVAVGPTATEGMAVRAEALARLAAEAVDILLARAPAAPG